MFACIFIFQRNSHNHVGDIMFTYQGNFPTTITYKGSDVTTVKKGTVTVWVKYFLPPTLSVTYQSGGTTSNPTKRAILNIHNNGVYNCSWVASGTDFNSSGTLSTGGSTTLYTSYYSVKHIGFVTVTCTESSYSSTVISTASYTITPRSGGGSEV